MNFLLQHKKYVIIGVLLLALLFTFTSTNVPTGMLNQFTDMMTKDVRENNAKLKKANDTLVIQRDMFKKKFEIVEKEKKQLRAENKELTKETAKVNKKIKNIKRRKSQIIRPKDLYEASNILNTIGYDNIVLQFDSKCGQ